NDDYADWADAKLIKKATDTSNITYISEMSWLSSSNGWGPIMRDYAHSGVNGTNLTPLTLGGQEYAKGVGAHAESEIQVALDGNYETFKAIVGADDIAGQWANVVFKVYGDGELLFESPQMLPGDTPVSIDIDVSGVDILTLYADPGTYPNDDYADWADARLEKSTEATITDPTTTHGSGLIYLRNRWYDPSIGRFINQDPVKDDFNWYIYCHNDPMNFRDPSGLSDILLRKFVESNGGTVTPNQHEFLGIKWGLKSITVSLNGITREFSAGSTYNTYRINEKSFSLMDDKFLLNAFFGDIGSGTDTNPTKQQIVNHITRRAYYADIPKNLAFAVAYTESTMQQIQNSTGRVDNGGGDWGIMQINDENVPRYTDAYGDIIGNWHNNVNAGVEHIRVCYAEVLELGYTGDEIYKATYSNYNSGSASKYTYNTEVADNVNRFWEIYNGQIWR
ncbi:MAG: NPCBM/NEW2 domain-containing protein, partial [Clostridiales bacterium]|nr:NPCBM/NEW2 domain-containing protein [Clostridiales bacterium]